MRRAIPLLIAALLIATLPGCGNDPEETNADEPASTPDAVEAPDFFVEEGQQRGLLWAHTSGASGRRFMPEMLGSGVALFDADGDGDLDCLLINGGPLPGVKEPAPNALFFNNGQGRFSRRLPLGALSAPESYGVGCAVADVDGDGDLDVFVSNWGPDALYLNDGNGKFRDVSKESGLSGSSWGASAAFGDVNGDGLPDLYVSNYLVWTMDKHSPCFQRDVEIYCGPAPFPGERDQLYINLGGGRFRDETADRFEESPEAKGLGVVMCDFDHDGDLDIYVANDETPNNLFVNDGSGSFTDIGPESGTALSSDAQPEAGMGVAFADYDNDGREDIAVTNFEDQTNSVYRNEGEGFFEEMSFQTGIGYDSRPMLGWGIGFVDFDQDGWKDLFTANGHIYDNAERLKEGASWAQQNRLNLNLGNGRFGPGSDHAIPALQLKAVSRAAAFGDIDNDGDIDVIVTNVDDRPHLLINNGAKGGSLQVQAEDEHGLAIAGTRIELQIGETRQYQSQQGSFSYLAHNDTRVHFGTAEAKLVDAVVIHWLGGETLRFESVPSNGLLRVRRSGDAQFFPRGKDQDPKPLRPTR